MWYAVSANPKCPGASILIVRTVAVDDVEDHVCFRLLCFHVNQARFMVSAENFMKVLFFTYDFVCSYEHNRVHMAACEGFPQYLQPDGGLHLSPNPLHVCGGVPIRRCGPVYQVHRHRCNQGHERHTLHVLYTSVQSLHTTRQFVACTSSWMTGHRHSWFPVRRTPQKFRTTVPHPTVSTRLSFHPRCVVIYRLNYTGRVY